MSSPTVDPELGEATNVDVTESPSAREVPSTSEESGGILDTLGNMGNKILDTLIIDEEREGVEPYYWETDLQPVPLTKKLTHNIHWLYARTWGTMEYVGEFFAEALGIYNSRYAWALDMQHTSEDAEYMARVQADREMSWREAERRANEAETDNNTEIEISSAAIEASRA